MRDVLSGRYRVQEVFFNICQQKHGWYYEHARDRSQRNMEKNVVLEVSKIQSGEEGQEQEENSSTLIKFIMTSKGILKVF